jgi:hypothetical protein
MPDISGLDLAAGILNASPLPRLGAENTSQPTVENQNMPSQRVNAEQISNVEPSLDQSSRNIAGANQIPASAQNVANEVVRNESVSHRESELSEKEAMLQKANEEKDALQKVT